jgi:hypothetical protein
MLSRLPTSPWRRALSGQQHLADVSIWRKKLRIDNTVILLEKLYFLKG